MEAQTAVMSGIATAGLPRRWLWCGSVLAVVGVICAGSSLMPLRRQQLPSASPNANGEIQPGLSYRASVRGGGVAAVLGRRGITVSTSGGRLSLELVAVGRGSHLRRLGAVTPRIRSGRVVYARDGGVLEWYAPSRWGVEQSFSLAHRPAGKAGVLTWELAVEGMRARQAGSVVEFSGWSRAVALRYRGLAAFDASGRRLPASLAVVGSRLLLRVADHGARYPLRIDPMLARGSTAAPSGGSFTVSHLQANTRDGSVSFRVRVPGRGRIDVLETAWKDNFATAASLLQPAAGRFVFARLHASASAPSTLRLRILPGGRGKQLLRAHRYQVTTRLWVTFTPVEGKARRIGFYGLKLTRAASRPLLGSQAPFVMRALGDSVTAGFGFFANGSPMSLLDLPFCRPLDTTPNDRCSSNSPNGAGQTGPVGWSPDYGLANNVSWAAQAAHTLGLSGSSEFQNLAVSGSTPADWALGGYLNPILDQIVGDDPDLTVMTLGANPLLSIFLAGSGAWCAFKLTDPALRECVQRYIASQRVGPLLQEVVGELLAAPRNHVVVSLYQLAVPSLTLFTVHDVEILFSAFNATIDSAVRSLPSYGSRVFVISPPTFFTGVGPGNYICPSNRAAVDGPSHQSADTQDELSLEPFTSFCSGTPWIISSDTGIHPNRAGYAQFASALVALVRRQSWGPASARLPPGRG